MLRMWMCQGWREAAVSRGVSAMPRLSAAKAAGAKTGADGVVRGPPLGLALARKQGWMRRRILGKQVSLRGEGTSSLWEEP